VIAHLLGEDGESILAALLGLNIATSAF